MESQFEFILPEKSQTKQTKNNIFEGIRHKARKHSDLFFPPIPSFLCVCV